EPLSFGGFQFRRGERRLSVRGFLVGGQRVWGVEDERLKRARLEAVEDD
ncbi:MAG: hypothetical protein ACI80K_002176, partial [Paracoccaceae bacterium]